MTFQKSRQRLQMSDECALVVVVELQSPTLLTVTEDNLEGVYNEIRRTATDPIANLDKQRKRRSQLGSIKTRHQQPRLPNEAELERMRKLSSLQRTLKVTSLLLFLAENSLSNSDDVMCVCCRIVRKSCICSMMC